MTIFPFLSKLLSPKPAKQAAEIVIENAGFRLKEGGALKELWPWANQEEVLIGRTVLDTREHFWMDFFILGNDNYFTVDEEMLGFEALLAAMENKLPGFDKEWRGKIVQPQLDTDDINTNLITVYQTKEKTS
jgi:hypothetical protein